MPILLFAVAFGLSTDYAVFLLSRIKEARDNGASDSECVAIGLERTGRIVTAAALLFAVAIGAFATSQIIFIKENGVGTALAVLIDASIIRALLVPSLMELLGKWNWWAPAPLRRLHERFGISETAGAGAGPSAPGRPGSGALCVVGALWRRSSLARPVRVREPSAFDVAGGEDESPSFELRSASISAGRRGEVAARSRRCRRQRGGAGLRRADEAG